MTRLRMIKDWGPHKAGDIICPQMQRTVDWLVNVYKGAVIDGPDMPITVIKPGEPASPNAPEAPPEPKFLRKPRRDKMLKLPVEAKSRKARIQGGD
jgi:hypothetical protein